MAQTAVFVRATREGRGARVVPALVIPLSGFVVSGAAGWLVADRLGPNLAGSAAGAFIGATGYVLVLSLVNRALLKDLAKLARRAGGGCSLAAGRSGHPWHRRRDARMKCAAGVAAPPA